ncbi:MAG: hypothetical protein JNK48_18195 [Bryobacterales bacterium]|nr:hypothetical protein [Bryobacterales bacterium]
MAAAQPTRRGVLTAMFTASPALLPSATRGVLAVSGSRIPAYAEAIEGLRAGCTGCDFRVLLLDQLGKGEQLCLLLNKAHAGVVVGVGSAALQALRGCVPLPPLVATMILTPPGSARGQVGRVEATVTLDVPPETVLQRMRRLYPERKRMALVRGPALGEGAAAEIRSSAQRLGISLDILPCASPKDLLDSVEFLSQAYDFLWCLPDADLYQGPAVPALVLSAMRRRMPVVAFSEGMVRAGALIGFYPDYRDIGVQTAEIVIRRIDGLPAPARQGPRKVKTAVNERVARALGIEAAAGPEVEVFR